MTKHISFARTAAALRDLDPAAATALTAEERQRADAMLARILTTPIPSAGHEHLLTETDRPRRRRGLVLGAGLLAAAVVAAPIALGGGSAFASWTATPAPLSAATAAAAATTCRSTLDIHDQTARIVIGERRGGWNYVLLSGPSGEAACLMPDGLVGAGVGDRKKGFFGSYDPAPPEAPTPARDGIIETESMGGIVSVPDRLSVGTVEGWFSWVTGYAGRDVTGVTVHPPVGPDVEASLKGGRFSAWWPAGEARGDNPGVGGAWTYDVTLTDGTTRPVEAP